MNPTTVPTAPVEFAVSHPTAHLLLIFLIVSVYLFLFGYLEYFLVISARRRRRRESDEENIEPAPLDIAQFQFLLTGKSGSEDTGQIDQESELQQQNTDEELVEVEMADSPPPPKNFTGKPVKAVITKGEYKGWTATIQFGIGLQGVIDRFYEESEKANKNALQQSFANPATSHKNFNRYMETPESKNPFTRTWSCAYCRQETSFRDLLNVDGDEDRFCSKRNAESYRKVFMHCPSKNNEGLAVMPLNFFTESPSKFQKFVHEIYPDFGSFMKQFIQNIPLGQRQTKREIEDAIMDDDDDLAGFYSNIAATEIDDYQPFNISDAYFTFIHPWAAYTDLKWVVGNRQTISLPSSQEDAEQSFSRQNPHEKNGEATFIEPNWTLSGTEPDYRMPVEIYFLPFVVLKL